MTTVEQASVRLLRGMGAYVDDIRLPGMLYGAILRSPYPHARIVSIDTSAAEAHPEVVAVIVGGTLARLDLARLPDDTRPLLAIDKIRFQGQEVAFVVARDHYSARDALELIDVGYEPLPPVVDARRALDPDAPVVRDDQDGQADNHSYDRATGDAARTGEVFANAEVVVAEDIRYPRVPRAPLQPRGSVADFDKVTGKLTVWATTHALHAHRRLYALVAGLPEQTVRVIAPDIGDDSGEDTGVHPGHVLAVVGSIVSGRPVKWVEDHLVNSAPAGDHHLRGEIAATRDGTIQAVRATVIADHGAFHGTAQPAVFTCPYDLRAAHCSVTGVHTNNAPAGSGAAGAASYLVERMVDLLAAELDLDPATLRLRNLLRPERFPYTTPTGLVYDSGDYPRTLRLAMDIAGYAALRDEQAARRERGELMGIGLAFFTGSVGAGGADHAELRVYPTGAAVLRIPAQPLGPGHGTALARIVARELGIPAEDVQVVRGDTDRTSTPVPGAAVAMVARTVRERAKILASTALGVAPGDLAWEHGRFLVAGDPETARTVQEIARLAEGDLAATSVYLPDLTYPFGAHICVVDVDAETGVVTVRRFIAVDDCGVRIDPMIVEGRIHGALADGVGTALMASDPDGDRLAGSSMDHPAPTSLECPSWELGETITANGPGGSAAVGSPAAVVNAVLDALRPYGVRHVDMPLTPAAVWSAINGRPR